MSLTKYDAIGNYRGVVVGLVVELDPEQYRSTPDPDPPNGQPGAHRVLARAQTRMALSRHLSRAIAIAAQSVVNEVNAEGDHQ